MSLDRLQLPAGTLLFSRGEEGDVAYLIQSGEIEIFLPGPEGEVRLAVRRSGEIIGEMAIIDAGPRSTSARLLSDSELVLITAQQVKHRIAETDPILRMYLEVVIARYRDTVALIGTLDRSELPALIETSRPIGPEFVAVVESLTLEGELRRAVERDEFRLHYQPIVHLPSRRLAGFEALMRWHHPERGLVPPSHFIPTAESSGVIVEMTAWALREIGRVLPTILSAGLANVASVDPLFVSVNITGHDLARPAFAALVATILDEAGVDASSVKLELTESMLMEDPAEAGRVLEECRRSGMGIAVDDFGTGYSSLSHLSTLPITTLKIDRAFVRCLKDDATSRKIVNTILRLARELDIPVVAEGIEEVAEAEILTGMGCAYGQGYLFGRPVPIEETLAVTRGWMSNADLLGAGAPLPAAPRAASRRAPSPRRDRRAADHTPPLS
jgi:EAL domain-containing protein (putative c-di-GMP-specific phosphodiesterase class I)